jgi:hypothetical protein
VTADNLSLRLARPGEAAPALPRHSDVHVWRTADGHPIAYGFRQDGRYWMQWPLVGTYGFAPGESTITAYPLPGTALQTVADLYGRTVLPMALQAFGFEALHASAIETDRGVVAFAAPSMTGKSTIAFGLRRLGYSQWADDAVVFRTTGGAVEAVPLAFTAKLRPGAAGLIETAGAAREPRWCPIDEGSTPERAPARFAAICLLERLHCASSPVPVEIRRLTPADAFPAVLTHAHVFDPFDLDRRKRMMQAYLALAAAVPVYKARFIADPERFSALLDVLATTINPHGMPDSSRILARVR